MARQIRNEGVSPIDSRGIISAQRPSTQGKICLLWQEGMYRQVAAEIMMSTRN